MVLLATEATNYIEAGVAVEDAVYESPEMLLLPKVVHLFMKPVLIPTFVKNHRNWIMRAVEARPAYYSTLVMNSLQQRSITVNLVNFACCQCETYSPSILVRVSIYCPDIAYFAAMMHQRLNCYENLQFILESASEIDTSSALEISRLARSFPLRFILCSPLSFKYKNNYLKFKHLRNYIGGIRVSWQMIDDLYGTCDRSILERMTCEIRRRLKLITAVKPSIQIIIEAPPFGYKMFANMLSEASPLTDDLGIELVSDWIIAAPGMSVWV